MSAIELAQAYNQGVRDTLAAADAAASAIERMPGFKESRQGFATAALRGLAQNGAELLLGKSASAQEASKAGASP